MNRATCVVLVGAAWLLAGSMAGAQEGEESGSSLYKTYCSSCHGKTGKGDGALAASLRNRPSDLTTFAKREDGKWDAEKVRKIIDGRESVRGHGGPDMPVWANAFRESTSSDSDAKVKARIDALVEHLADLQDPPLPPPAQK